MTSLPRTRPQRRSARRASAAVTEPAAEAKPAAAKPAAKAKPATRAKAAPKRAPGTPKATAAAKPRSGVRASKPGAAGLPPRGYATPTPEPEAPPSGVALVTTAIQAAGELAQIGVAVAGQAAKSALSKLPRP